MKINSWFLKHLAIEALVVLFAMLPAAAQVCPNGPNLKDQPCNPLQFHGGPVLANFTIYPLYLGKWSQADIDEQQAFLKNLTGYISGDNAPAGEQPVIRQYGVYSAQVAAAAIADTSLEPSKYVSTCLAGSRGTYKDPPPLPAVAGTLYFCDVPEIIAKNQKASKLPKYGPDSLIMVFPASGFNLDPTCSCLGYHSSLSASSFFGIIAPGPFGSGEPYSDALNKYQVVTSHEVFEGSTDPGDNNFNGWDEAADQCDTSVSLKWPGGVSFQFAAIIDNTANAACTTNGYTTLSELQAYGWTYANYRAEYNKLWPQGWRLYILQSYVLSNGQVLYNAVWRPMGNTPEYQLYGGTFNQFITEYNKLFPEGWRIYILQTYVTPDGNTHYNAVWRPGTSTETQMYGVTYEQFRDQYNKLFPWPDYWRLYILQSYTAANGQVLYNAVWRQPDYHMEQCACANETQVYEWTYDDYRNDYNKLWNEGWRLYILDSYVISDGTVRYNAVWRPATHGEIQIYGATYSDYRTEYNKLWNEGLRLYSLTTYVLPGDEVRYDAVWRVGTIDRPL